jgi:hypothetical protein
LIPAFGIVFYEFFLGIFLLYKVVNRGFHIKGEDKFIFLYLINGIILSLVDINTGIWGFRITFYPVIFYMICCSFFNEIRIEKGLKIIKNTGLIVAVIGIIMYFVIPRDLVFSFGYKYNFINQLEGYFYYQNVLRMMSVIWNPMAFGSYMMILSILYFNDVLNSRTRKRQLLNLISYLIIVTCLVFTMSRGSWSGAFAGHLIILVYNRKKIIKVAIVFALACVLFISMFSQYSSSLYQHLSTLGMSTDSGVTAYNQRSSQWKNAIDLFKSYPLGYGVGKIGVAQQRIKDRYGEYTENIALTDANYFKILAETGIQGIILFLLFLFTKLIKCIRSIRSPSDNSKGRGININAVSLAAITLGISLQAIGSNVWDFTALPYIYFFLIAMMNFYIHEWEMEYAKSEMRIPQGVKLCQRTELSGVL